MDIRDRLRIETQGYSMYDVRNDKYKPTHDDTINFEVSPTPFKLDKSQKNELENIGKTITGYMDCCFELYKNDEDVHELLDRGKPSKYRNIKNIRYLFLRPDLILTDTGFCICEIETSPFGLGLAEVLNRTYGNAGYNTAIHQNELKNYIQSKIPSKGTIAYSEKVKSFRGQLRFMADQLFSSDNKSWCAAEIGKDDIKEKELYRAFYLNEALSDEKVKKLLTMANIYLPSSTPQFEEKAILSLIWDKRYVRTIQNRLGKEGFELLRKYIPKTWVLGEEQYIDEGMPSNLNSSLDIAGLGKSKRNFVLKQSGFSNASSWGEGVLFLNKMGGEKARGYIERALADKEHLYIMQEFKQGKAVTMQIIDNVGEIKDKSVKVRITPYYAYMGQDKGKLIATKVTGCENTEYIHAGTNSINTALTFDEER